MRRLRLSLYVSFAATVLVLVAATFVEHATGSGAAVYGAWWFTALWALLAVVALAWVLRRRLWRRPAVFVLHVALLLILVGALVTHLWGEQGAVRLRLGEPTAAFTASDGSPHALPFGLRLERFAVECYPGTQSPMDYVSVVRTDDGGEMRISMNRIGRHRHYRFYQSAYDEDLRGTVLSVSHDPAGIALTYAGYALLFLSMLLLLVLPGEGFRRTLAALRAAPRAAAVALLAALAAAGPDAVAAPQVLPREVAAEFGRLYVYHGGRICPVQTVARDFTAKLCGRPSYRGFTADQVFTGWVLFPTTWLDEPMLRVKGEAAAAVGAADGYAAYADFFDRGAYRLEHRLHEGNRSVLEADEKMNILRMLFAGQFLRLYPYAPSADVSTDVPADAPAEVRWYSQGDDLPLSMPEEEWFFVKRSMDYVGELAVQRRYGELSAALAKIRTFQRRQAGAVLPADARFRAELLYNGADFTRPLFMALLTLGIVLFFVYVRLWLRGRSVPRLLSAALGALLVAVVAYLALLIGLRGYVAGHLPLSSGFETMQFMALAALVLTLLLRHRFVLVVPFGLITGGLTLLVSTLGVSNPQVTPLMPVLASPLLSVHVCVIMVAYVLLAFTALSGLTALGYMLGRRGKAACDADDPVGHLQLVSRLLLYPALFLLTAGIFIGAVWANVSWGTYWSWDPKETWALITMLVYAVALHPQTVPPLRRPMVFHAYMALAFLTILMTYFGVNYLLGGMHSYAAG